MHFEFHIISGKTGRPLPMTRLVINLRQNLLQTSCPPITLSKTKSNRGFVRYSYSNALAVLCTSICAVTSGSESSMPVLVFCWRSLFFCHPLRVRLPRRRTLMLTHPSHRNMPGINRMGGGGLEYTVRSPACLHGHPP